MNTNAPLIEQAKPVVGLSNTTPTASTPDYVSLKNFEKLTIIILALNATTVTGSAITVKQATDVSAGNEKALAFSKMYANTDVGADDALVETAVTNNTFTTATTNSKSLMYVIEINANDLDVDGGFDCVRAGTGNATAATLTVLYLLWPPKYGKGKALPSAIID